jgi:hypothetical protein
MALPVAFPGFQNIFSHPNHALHPSIHPSIHHGINEPTNDDSNEDVAILFPTGSTAAAASINDNSGLAFIAFSTR